MAKGKRRREKKPEGHLAHKRPPWFPVLAYYFLLSE